MKSNVASDTKIKQTATQDEFMDSKALEEVRTLWHELHELIHDHLQLAALETRRVGENLVAMIIASVVVAVLLLGAWLGVMAAVVLRLIEQGMVTSTALLIAVAVSLLIVLLLCGVIRYKSHYLQFPALLGSLQPEPAKQRTRDK